MFTESKKQKTMSSSSNQQNMITQGTSFVGDLISEAGFRIEGNVNGTIKTSGKVVVGKTGVINRLNLKSNRHSLDGDNR